MSLLLITLVQVGSQSHDQVWTGYKQSLLGSPVLGRSSSACLSLRAKSPSKISAVHSQLQETYPMQEIKQRKHEKKNQQNKTKSSNNNNKDKQTNKKGRKKIRRKKKKQRQTRAELDYIREVSVPLLGRRPLHTDAIIGKCLRTLTIMFRDQF